ncbi:MAG: alanine racemase [Rhizobium sp.]|nr:alanine racemase [Rhizobium sp.]
MDQTLTKNTGFDIAPARLTIDTGAIAANWRSLRSMAVASETGAVLKADAYGLGAEQVARILDRAGCRTFFVATMSEGEALRRWVWRGPNLRSLRLLGGAGSADNFCRPDTRSRLR